MSPRPRSITLRISLLFTGMTAIVLLTMGYLIGASVQHHFDEQDSVSVRGKLELIQNILAEENSAGTHAIERKLKDALVGHHELSVLVAEGDTVLFRSEHAAFLAGHLSDVVPYDAGVPLQLQQWHDDDHQHRGTVVSLAGRPEATTEFTVAIAVDAQQHQAFMAMFKLQLLLVGLAGLIMMGALGWIVTRRGLLPVSEMAHVAEGISAQRLGDRLQLEMLPLELHSLAISFNDMLDRLEGSLHRLSDYASDIAHEFRTPVNNLMTQTQVSLSRLRTADEYREILYSNLEEYERLARMISDMLFLAKADNGLVIPNHERVNVQLEIKALIEFYEALAAEKNIRLVQTGAADITGDPLMIRRALSNLLSNAIRHSKPDSVITMAVSAEQDGIHIAVTNDGDDISPPQLERIFDRFYRADASRARSDEGAGLGLAITRSIIEAHRGRVGVESAQGRTCFTVVLPTAS